jgi:hypothetical protein
MNEIPAQTNEAVQMSKDLVRGSAGTDDLLCPHAGNGDGQ